MTCPCSKPSLMKTGLCRACEDHIQQGKVVTPFKLWIMSESTRLNIKPHTLEMWLHRGKHPYPAVARRGPSGRVMEVLV